MINIYNLQQKGLRPINITNKFATLLFIVIGKKVLFIIKSHSIFQA